ncbi:MAG: SUMF1/EgtB/PvdO family nonheme iron enzyme [Planctomycetales bacterium]
MEPSSRETLKEWVIDVQRRTLQLLEGLSGDQLIGPQLPTVNPLRWEIGHSAWFMEKFVLREAMGRKPLLSNGDDLFDSIAIEHGERWNLPLPSFAKTLQYVGDVHDAVAERLETAELTDKAVDLIKLSVFHEDMHTEAFTYTRQTLSYPAPFPVEVESSDAVSDPRSAGQDVPVPGGEFMLGAARDEPFVFDNEKWAHPVELNPFVVAKCAVTQGRFAEFTDDGGYERPELWSDEGWNWRRTEGATHPIYWRKELGGDWSRRDFDRWIPLESHRAMVHVCWHEANAFCRWAKRRLPTETEWEAAAASSRENGSLSADKRRYPWGDDAPNPSRANLDWKAMGTIDATACPRGDSAMGCRQMIGNVWEWTATDFAPHPGFVVGPYKEFSTTGFGFRKTLRGGCWATRGRMLRNTLRNFYQPCRRDVPAGFRTCALEP